MSSIVDSSVVWPITPFLSGIAFMTFGASGLFLFKFWSKTKENFFLDFAIACWLLAAERILFLIYSGNFLAITFVLGFRLIAFSLVIVAIFRANRSKRWS